MSTQFFKRSLFARAIAFIIIVNFIFINGPVTSVLAADALRPRAESNENPGARDLADALKKQALIERLVVKFSEIRKDDVAIAGGKGANLGELQHVAGISVPDGVAVTTKVFQLHIDKGMVEIENKQKITLREYIERRLKKLEAAKGGYENSEALAEAGQDIRTAIQLAEMPAEVKDEITKWYEEMCREAGVKDLPVAVRSSATAEDMADASFAGQQDTYLNMRGTEQVLDAVKRDWASLFTDRAIFYRHEQKIDHGTAYLSAIIQRMIQSKIAGTGFSVEMTSGFEAIRIDAAWGLGEGVVSGTAAPDSWIVVKDKSGRLRILRREFGTKLQKVVYKTEGEIVGREGTELVDTNYAERHVYCLTDSQVLELAKAIDAIQNHYGRYMDVEWGFDENGKLWILQARSETIWNQWRKQHPDTTKIENLVVPDDVAAKARNILPRSIAGSKAASGKVVIIDSAKKGLELAKDLARVKQGDIMVTTMTNTDMVPAMKRAGAIVTDQGGPTCHAAIIAREVGIPCVVGTAKATQLLKEGMVITVDANRAMVYEGAVRIEKITKNIHTPSLPKTKTKIGIIAALPSLAMGVWGLSEFPSHYGVSLLRKEMVDAIEIRVHPLAGLAYDKYYDPNFKDEKEKQWIKENVIDKDGLGEHIGRIISGYKTYSDFYKDKLANAIALIAATQTKGQRVKFRTTDFKTNEYRDQIGGSLFEPEERNPMMGYRGIYRMLSDSYKEAFELELESIKLARQEQTNIDVMFPVVRTVEEMEEAAALMAQHGLFEGDDPCQLGIMVEVSANVILADEFFSKLAELAKKYHTKAFMSIGSNDLTQFTLGLGRDNEKMKPFFDENNPAVRKAIEIVIKTAKKYGITTGLCGQRPSNDPNFAAFLVESGIDSIGVVPEVYDNVVNVVAKQEKELEGKPFDSNIAGWEMPSTLTMGNPQKIAAAQVDGSEIIKELGIHPLTLLHYNKAFLLYRGRLKISNLLGLKKKITGLSGKTAREYVVNKVYQALMDKAKSTPADMPIIYSTDDLDKTVYEKLIGGEKREPFDENPQLGFCGLARVVDPEYQEFFRWQLEGIKKAREASGRTNIWIQLDLVRTTQEVEKALSLIKEAGLIPGENSFRVGMEIAVTADVLLLNEFIKTGIGFLTENKDRYLSYVIAEDPNSEFIQVAAQRKEKLWENSRKVWTNAAEKNNIPLVGFEGEVLPQPTEITPPQVPSPISTPIITSTPAVSSAGAWKTSIPMLLAYKDKLDGRRVYLRVDLNVLNDKGEFESLTRFDDVIEACNIIIKAGGTPVIVTHVGRPKGKVVANLSVAKVVDKFDEMAKEKGYSIPVHFLAGSVNEAGLKPGLKNEIVSGAANFLENIRFTSKEESRDKVFAEELADLVDNYLGIFGGFGSGAVKGASTMDVFEYMENIAVDPSVETELNQISRIRNNIYMLIFGGGPKIDDKVPLLKGILGNFKKGGVLGLGSAPSVVFWKAKGKNINSAQPVEEATVKAADTIIKTAESLGIKLLPAVDFKVADRDVSKESKIPEGVNTYQLTVEELCQPFFTVPGTNIQIPTNTLYIYDLGDKSIENNVEAVRNMPEGSTSFWNGNTGVDFLETSSLPIAKALDKAKTEKGVDSMMAGGTTSELASRVNPHLENKILTSKGGSSALTAMQDGSIPVIDNMELIQANIELAQALNVSKQEYLGFANGDITIHNAQGGQALGTFTDDVLKYLQTLSTEALKNMKTQVIIVDPNFFRAGGVKSALEIVAKLSKVVRIALYGENAEKIKTLIGNENVITAKDIKTLYSVLLNMDIGNAIVLRSQDELPDNMKLVVRNVGDMQIVSSQLPTLAIAKALKELLNVKEIDDAFEKFLGQIKTDNVISEQAYNSNRAELLAKLKKGQIFEFSPDLKPTPAVTEKTEVEAARKQCEEFLMKIGV